jgi:adenylate cyclase
MPECKRDEHEFADLISRRLRHSSIAANVAGAVVVFLFLGFVLPAPKDLHNPWWVLALNGGLLVLSGIIGLPLASIALGRLWRERTEWVSTGRTPTERERELTLRYPLTQHQIIAGLWLLDAVVFAMANMFFSLQLAANVAITVTLGGLVTVALGYLMCERLLRPITAMALSTGLPARPQLPGVAARALLSWTLGTGVVLLGLVLVGAGALIVGTFTVTQLAVVVLVLSGIGFVVGLTTMVGLARSLADPIVALRTAVARVEQGDTEQDVKVDDGSEVGLLQAGFNRMLAGLREREKLRDLFGRQVGEDVVRHALEHGVELGGEAREAAVLFVDLQGSTRLAQQLDPADVVSILNDFFAVVIEVAARHGGWVNKFEGDAALCVFGAPLVDTACAAKALAAGRELSARLHRDMSELAAGIGISAGRVVAGNVGAAMRFEYTVIGDPVNEAARLSELAKAESCGVLASGAALAAAGEAEQRNWCRRGEITLRGRSRATVIAEPAAPVGPDRAGERAMRPRRPAAPARAPASSTRPGAAA